jgi:hypothetical protein
MKKIIISKFPIAFLLLLITSCNNKTDFEPTIISEEIAAAQYRGGETITSFDSYIAAEFIGTIGSCNYNSVIVWGSFNKKTDDAGTISIEDNYLNKIVEDGKTRYLKEIAASDIAANELSEQGTVSCDFYSAMPATYTSFSKNISVPAPLCIETSIGNSEVLSKSNDLDLTWESDVNTDKLYVSVCTPGLPCVLKEFDDAEGEATISSSEFAEFVSGEPVFFYIGRGITKTLKQSDGKEIGLIGVQWFNYPGLKVE